MDSPATRTGPRLMNVVVAPGTQADALYQAFRARTEELAPGFKPEAGLDLTFHGGKTIADLTYTNFFLGGASAWEKSDVENIDGALATAMSHVGLNNMLAQYFEGNPPTTTFRPSQIVEGTLPDTVFKDQVEERVLRMFGDGALAEFDLAASVFNFLLPSGIVLSSEPSTGPQEAPDALLEGLEEEADSQHGLGGYHGSVHPGGGPEIVYYSVGVFSEHRPNGNNGIVAFAQPWKNVVATFYHELVEARSDADVDDVHDTSQLHLLGWYSFASGAGEIGDTPINEAEHGGGLSTVFVEIDANGSGKIPIQLMYSNAVHGPEGPVDQPRQPA
jgi:hypothetical protein